MSDKVKPQGQPAFDPAGSPHHPPASRVPVTSSPHQPSRERQAPALRERLAAVRLLAMDVDGVLTDGSITWTAGVGGGEGVESKSFSVKDGLGLTLARIAGIPVIWITGRASAVVERRAAELGVTELCSLVHDKAAALEAIRGRHRLPTAAILYAGDDLNDVPAFRVAGVRVAVADAAPELQAEADWITRAAGGCGAIREVVEGVLRAQGRWPEVLEQYYQRLRHTGAGEQ